MRRFLCLLFILAFAASPAAFAARDLYQILGVSQTATAEEIKQAYRRLAMKYHPDRNPHLDRSVFQEMKAAYDILSDETQRKAYDNFRGRTANQGYGGSPRPGAQNTNYWDQQRARGEEEARRRQEEYAREQRARTEEARRRQEEYARQQKQQQESQKVSFARKLEDQIDVYLAAKVSRNEERIERHSALLAELFQSPEALKYPELVQKLMGRGGWEFVVKEIFTKAPWRNDMMFPFWLKQTSQQLAGLKPLFKYYFPTMGIAAEKRSLIQSMILGMRVISEGLTIIAENIPLSERGVDYSAEFKELIQYANRDTRAILAKRFEVFLTSPMIQAPPAEYYNIAEKLGVLNKPAAAQAETRSAGKSTHPANLDVNYTAGPPPSWGHNSDVWYYDETWLENMLRTVFEAPVHYRRPLFDDLKEIDFTTPKSPGYVNFEKAASKFITRIPVGSLKDPNTAQMMIKSIFSLPWTVNFPQLVRKIPVDGAVTTDAKFNLHVKILEEISRHENWLQSPELLIWIEFFHAKNSKLIDNAIETYLIRYRTEDKKQAAREILATKGGAMMCSRVLL